MKVNNLAVLSGHVVVPLTEEQQKIADCITSINDLITVYAKELDALKRHKKALLQQLFSVSDKEQG